MDTAPMKIIGTSGLWMDFNSSINKPLDLSGKVIDGITKAAYAIFFYRVDSIDIKTALLNFFDFAMCILVASIFLSAMFIW